MFRVNDKVAVTFKGKKISGKIVGIDSYSLANFAGGELGWTSYTLVTSLKSVFARCWLIDRKKHGWFLTTAAKKKKLLPHSELVLERSGITRIKFDGEKGISSPASALLVYKTGKEEYYGTERFEDSEVYYFASSKITSPEKVS